MDWVMAREEFRRLRAALLAAVQGNVLELGIGTCLNLSHYPATVTELCAVDPADFLPKTVASRIAAAPFPVRVRHVAAEALPYDDRSFDFVVSTWTLCTIPDPVQALREVGRVLKPEGTLLFLEHGRSDNEKIARWQDRLNPVQNILGCGCNLNRQIEQLIIQAGLTLVHLDRFRMACVPRLGGEMYRGTARSLAALSA
jgi:ubiquinone/menaquinone biosynthesis C-methylase UbiE